MSDGNMSPGFEDGEGSPILSIRSSSPSPINIRSAFEDVTGEIYENENGINYRLRNKGGNALGTNVYKVHNSIYKMAQGDRRETIQNEIAVYEKIRNLEPDDKRYFLEMKHGKARGSVVHIELEYFDGVDLVTYFRKEIPKNTTSYIARSIAYALRILARLHIVHGDIHLGNIMIPESDITNPRPQIKLIDFGHSAEVVFNRKPFYNLDPESEDNYLKLLSHMPVSRRDLNAIHDIIVRNIEKGDVISSYDEIIKYWDVKKGGRRVKWTRKKKQKVNKKWLNLLKMLE